MTKIYYFFPAVIVSLYLTSTEFSHILYLVILNIKEWKMNDKYIRQMKKGVLDMLVLKLLEKDKKYGYQIISELKEKSDELFILKEGTLYPILYRLEDDALVESSWSCAKGKQTARKYYQITEKGRQVLGEIAEIWIKMSCDVRKIMED